MMRALQRGAQRSEGGFDVPGVIQRAEELYPLQGRNANTLLEPSSGDYGNTRNHPVLTDHSISDRPIPGRSKQQPTKFCTLAGSPDPQMVLSVNRSAHPTIVVKDVITPTRELRRDYHTSAQANL